jgi:hypothetical protein
VRGHDDHVDLDRPPAGVPGNPLDLDDPLLSVEPQELGLVPGGHPERDSLAREFMPR